MGKEFIFVYNAKSGLFNKASDFAHKIVSPQTYNCSLCSITYGNFSAHKEWADFIASLKLDVKFLYKNDFETLFPDEKTIYPVVYVKEGCRLNKLLTASEIGKQKELKGLIQLIINKIK
jgi:hypothetical protein